MLEAYERLIHDAMSGDHTLFTTAEGIERLWELSMPLLESSAARSLLRARLVGTERHPPADRAARLAAAVRAGLAHQAAVAPERQAASWKTRPRLKRSPDRMTDTPWRTGAAVQPRVEAMGRSRVVKANP